jgi:Ca2+-binding EF-hand superfamily protein
MMMKMKQTQWNTSLLTAIAVICAGTMAQAASPSKGTRVKARPAKDANIVIANTFALADLDSNGEISSVEFVEHVHVFSFKRLDADQNKSVTSEEWAAAETGPESAAMFAQLDKNSDGRVTLKEFKAKPKGHEPIVRIFSTLDTNEDGVLRLQEFDVKE